MVEDKKVGGKEVEEKKEDIVTNGDIFVAMPVLFKLGEVGFGVDDSLELRKLRQILTPAHEVMSDIRNGLIRKHGQEALKGSGQLEIIGPNDEKGRPMSKSFPKFVEDQFELFNKKAEVDFKKVKLPRTDAEGKPVPLSSNDIDRVEKFIEMG